MQANIEYIQKDNILNKFMYFTDEEDEQQYSKYYLNQHYRMMYMVYFVVFSVNMSLIAKILVESGFHEPALIPIFINQILVIVISICIQKKKNIYNKLSCVINIIFAIEVYFYQKRFKSSDLNDYYQLCGFIIYGSHNSLMLSSQILYDSIGILVNFSIYTYQLNKDERVIELLLMWCIIIITIYQKFQHHKFTRFLYVSMQHQQEWIDVIENVLPSAIISIQQGKQQAKSQNLRRSDYLSNTQQQLHIPQDKHAQINSSGVQRSLNINSQKQPQIKCIPQTGGQPVLIQQQSLQNGMGMSEGQQNQDNDSEDNVFKQWDLNLVNGQSKESYSIMDMESFVTFSQSVLIDTKELLMETSTAVNGNILSPTHPHEGHKQLELSNATNNQLNFTINPLPSNMNGKGQHYENTANLIQSNGNISNQVQPLFSNIVQNGQTSIQASPARYSLKGHTMNAIDIQQSKGHKKLNIYDKNNTLPVTDNYLNNQGQLCSGAMSLQAEGGSPYVTLYRQLKALVEDNSHSKQRPKFFVWKLNGKYYPPPQKTNEQHSLLKDKGNADKSSIKERSVVSIQIKVCGFRGKQTRIVLCIDDISISEKIQLYKSQDKYKDLVLANAAHDLRQPLTALNYTILEAKKLFNKFQSQNIYSFLYQYYPQEFQMLTTTNPILQSIIPNAMVTSKINQADLMLQLLQSNYLALNVKSSLAPDCTELQMIVDLLEMADISGSSLKYLINDILDHAKLREGKLQVNFKDCLLSQIIQFTKKMFDFTFKEKGIKYRIINQAELASDVICTDQQRLQQVLVNLLSNSLKFTSSNKYIILHITKVIKQVHNRDVSLLKISVIDQGCGMSQEQLEQIFKPYVSFNNNNLNVEGIGLGLNICRSIIGLLGPYPKLYVRSRQNEGTKFYFYIYHQLRKGSTTQRGSNKTNLKLPAIVQTVDDKTDPKSANETKSKYLERRSQNHLPSSAQRVGETDQDYITTKGLITGKEPSKKQSDSIELPDLNDVVEKKRVLSIIEHTSRSNTHNEFNEHQMNQSEHKSSNPKKATLILTNNQDIDHEDETANKQNLTDSQDKQRLELKVDNKSIDSEEETERNHATNDEDNEEEEGENDSYLNITSIIMQLPDLYEEETEFEMQSPLAKHSRRNLLSKYSQTGKLLNPITSLNSQRSAKLTKFTPRSADNLNSLENTFYSINRNNNNDDRSFYPLQSNEPNVKDVGDLFYQNSKTNVSQDQTPHYANNVSFNNGQQSESFLLHRQVSGGFVNSKAIPNTNQILKQSNQGQSSTINGFQLSGQFYPHQSTNINMSQYSFSNQYQVKQSQFNNNLNSDTIANGKGNFSAKQYPPNSADTYVKLQSAKPNHGNSAFMPVASSQLINNSSNNNNHQYSTKTGSRSKISRPPTLVSNSSNSIINNISLSYNNNTNQNPNSKQKKAVKNLPPILTQFQKKYPNALNEMDQSTGSFIINIQKEELQVLIVDDEAFNISVIKMMLRKSDQFTFQIKDCSNGKDALNEFQKRNKPSQQKPITLVITDIHMPIMGGIESTKLMRKSILEQNYQQAVFIGISGLDQEAIDNDPDLHQDFKIFDVVLSKPLNEQQIINAINQNLLDFY